MELIKDLSKIFCMYIIGFCPYILTILYTLFYSETIFIERCLINYIIVNFNGLFIIFYIFIIC